MDADAITPAPRVPEPEKLDDCFREFTSREVYAYAFGRIAGFAGTASDALAAGADPAEVLASLLTFIERVDAAKDRALDVKA